VAGRYLIPLAFLAIVIAVIANVLLLSADPSSELAWWVNQEIYSRLRGLIYLLDDASVSPPMALLAAIAVGLLCYRMRRRTFVCFAANHAAAVALFFAAFSDFSVKAAAIRGAPPLHLLLSVNWDWPVLAALLVALVSCIPCHLDYLLASRRRRG